MAWKKSYFGETPDHLKAELYTLTNSNGVSASFTTLGGVWVSMLVPDKNGTFGDVVLGYDNFDSYLKNQPHFGAPIGRYANRIANAQFTLNGVVYQLEANSGTNNLHSAPDLYHTRIWEAEAEETGLGTRLSFHLHSPHMDQGYPGNADITVSYTLTEEDSLIINYHVICDQDTVVNFTNHSYFNLAGQGSGQIMDQEVWIDADTFTAINDALIPTGEYVLVKGTPMDFKEFKPIGREIDADYEPLNKAGGYDHNWVLNHAPGETALSAMAKDPKSGRVMEVYTDLPGMQFYTANFLNDSLTGKEGASYTRRSAYCFETQYYPNAVNIPEFPSPVLKAGQEALTTTIYKFRVEK